jgi:hypothetical protein
MKSVKVVIEINIDPAIAAELRHYARFRKVTANSVTTDAVSCVFGVLENMEVLISLPRATNFYLENLMDTDRPFQRWKKNHRASIAPATPKKTSKAAKKPRPIAVGQ